jgi:hypothetical protein
MNFGDVLPIFVAAVITLVAICLGLVGYFMIKEKLAERAGRLR